MACFWTPSNGWLGEERTARCRSKAALWTKRGPTSPVQVAPCTSVRRHPQVFIAKRFASSAERRTQCSWKADEGDVARDGDCNALACDVCVLPRRRLCPLAP